MSGLLPVAVFGLEVPPGDILIPIAADFPATIRLTMAALDPTEEPEADEEGNVPSTGRSTLRLVKERLGDLEDSDEDEDDESLQALLGSDDEDEDEDDEPNGGPSDPSKSKKARQAAEIKKLLESAEEEDSDEEMEDGDKEKTGKANGVKPKSKKGKEPATDEDEDEDSDEAGSEDDEGLDLENFVICTLDTERSYQQPIDITIPENEKAFFVVSGTHAIHLTGNYVIDETEESDSDEDDDDYDLPPDLEELLDGGESEDELDDIEAARIKEVDTDNEDQEEAPKLVESKKGKKRAAVDDDEVEGLDDLIAKDAAVQEVKLSKKQLKKLKNNKGQAVGVEETKSVIKETTVTPGKSDKKVQFAKNLEQGPSGSAEKEKAKAGDDKSKATLGKKVVQGVSIDDRTLGKGRQAKSGDRVNMRYIGKLESNGKVFDSNKKGTPFSFKIGAGEVIKGWDIGIAGMAVGGERRLTIPPSLAYGKKSPPGIPSNSTLVFDVKLLDIR